MWKDIIIGLLSVIILALLWVIYIELMPTSRKETHAQYLERLAKVAYLEFADRKWDGRPWQALSDLEQGVWRAIVEAAIREQNRWPG